MKVARHEKIIELIRQYDIDTQEELAARLNEAGFKVTQATVSRDIRALKTDKGCRKRREIPLCDPFRCIRGTWRQIYKSTPRCTHIH